MISTPELFSNTFSAWAEEYMKRSMHDFMEFTRSSGLSMSQFGALLRLYHGEICGVSDIGVHLGVSNAAASQLVDRLVGLGYLERTEDQNDRRYKTLSLSFKGCDLVQASIEIRQRWIANLTASLTPEQQATIIEALVLLTEASRQLDTTKKIEVIN